MQQENQFKTMNYITHDFEHKQCWGLSMDLNEASDEHERILRGNEFHKRGANTEKALFPLDRDVFGSIRRCLSAERKPVREEVYGKTSSVM